MNCKDFRLQIDAAPAEDSDDRDLHLAECAECAEYLARASAFDELVHRAMHVPAPAFDTQELRSESAEVVDLNTARTQKPAARSFSTPVWMSLAAGLVLAAFVANRFVDVAPSGADSNLLAAQILGHMVHEPYALKRTSLEVPSATVKETVSSVDAEVDDQIGLISYARSCYVNGESIPHLVVQGEHGPVTIMIMPKEHVDAVVPLENEDFHGAIVPAGDGSIAIIGRKGESIDDIRSKIGNSIRLSI